jgi:dienelactone hydrolase
LVDTRKVDEPLGYGTFMSSACNNATSSNGAGGWQTDPAVLRSDIADFLGFAPGRVSPTLQTIETVAEEGYRRLLVRYGAPDGDEIPAYLFIPYTTGPFPAVIVHHQHNGERFLGKSEICGLAGDPLQAFAPALATREIAVLAPDSLCFEDRRRQRSGRAPEPGADWLQHYNEMAYRLLSGDLLMRKVLADSALAVAVLASCEFVDQARIGMLGHSYGGNTVLFHAALDERIRFACSSGAASSYAGKMASDTGIEQAEVIPGFAKRWDIHHLVACIAPRPLLLVSATDDPYSCDAPAVEARGRWAYSAMGADAALEHLRFTGGHALTRERFEHIVAWITRQCVPR